MSNIIVKIIWTIPFLSKLNKYCEIIFILICIINIKKFTSTFQKFSTCEIYRVFLTTSNRLDKSFKIYTSTEKYCAYDHAIEMKTFIWMTYYKRLTNIMSPVTCHLINVLMFQPSLCLMVVLIDNPLLAKN